MPFCRQDHDRICRIINKKQGMSKKRITLYMEGNSQPRPIAWYCGTPHQDILNTIRAVSGTPLGPHSQPCCLPTGELGSDWDRWNRFAQFKRGAAEWGAGRPVDLSIHSKGGTDLTSLVYLTVHFHRTSAYNQTCSLEFTTTKIALWSSVTWCPTTSALS